MREADSECTATARTARGVVDAQVAAGRIGNRVKRAQLPAPVIAGSKDCAAARPGRDLRDQAFKLPCGGRARAAVRVPSYCPRGAQQYARGNHQPHAPFEVEISQPAAHPLAMLRRDAAK